MLRAKLAISIGRGCSFAVHPAVSWRTFAIHLSVSWRTLSGRLDGWVHKPQPVRPFLENAFRRPDGWAQLLVHELQRTSASLLADRAVWCCVQKMGTEGGSRTGTTRAVTEPMRRRAVRKKRIGRRLKAGRFAGFVWGFCGVNGYWRNWKGKNKGRKGRGTRW